MDGEEESIFRDGGLYPVFTRYVVIQAGEVVLLKNRAEFPGDVRPDRERPGSLKLCPGPGR